MMPLSLEKLRPEGSVLGDTFYGSTTKKGGVWPQSKALLDDCGHDAKLLRAVKVFDAPIIERFQYGS